MGIGKSGFTLSEVLTTVMLLGVIASYSVPKVLVSANNTERKSKALDAISVLEKTWYKLKFENEYFLPEASLPNTGSLYDVVREHLNVLDGSDVPGTGPLAAIPGHPCTGRGWIAFHSGIVITGLDNGPNIQPNLNNSVNNYEICLDFNGAEPPNVPGQDVYFGNFNASGNFDGAASRFQPGENAKNFYWGDPSNGARIFSPAGAVDKRNGVVQLLVPISEAGGGGSPGGGGDPGDPGDPGGC